MAIQITDDGATIKFVDDVNDKTINFNKRGTSLRKKGNAIEIIDAEYSEEFDFADVTVPVAVDADALITAIEIMLETPSGFDGAMVTSGAPSTASINNTSSILVPANADRNWVSITNLGSKNVFLALGQDAILNQGIGLIQNLGEHEFRAIDIGTEAIHAITTAGAAAVVAFLETSK